MVKFKRHAGAEKMVPWQLLHALEGDHDGSIKTFKVPGIPSAMGMTATYADGEATANAYWVEGRCMLGSGLYLPARGSASRAKIAAPVIAGIKSQHAREGGKCPS